MKTLLKIFDNILEIYGALILGLLTSALIFITFAIIDKMI